MPEYRNSGMPEKSQSGISIFTGIKLPQSGVSIPASVIPELMVTD
jgi:hypothetical protein